MRRLSCCLALALAACAPEPIMAPGPTTITITPAAQDFGRADVGSSSAPVLYTAQNTGSVRTGTLVMGFSGVGAGDFAISANGCTTAVALDPGASCTFLVALAPASNGIKGAQVVVRGDPGGIATANVSGIAYEPAHLALAPASHDFLDVVHGLATSSYEFTLSNYGDNPSGPPVVTITGPNASEFAFDPPFCTAVLPFLDCSVWVTFAPTAIGVKTATLHVTATPGGTVSATLVGTGT